MEDIICIAIKDLPKSSPEERTITSEFYRQAAIIQGDIWDEPPFEWVPPHNLQAADEIGGATLVAYVPLSTDGRVVPPEKASIRRVVGMIYETPGLKEDGSSYMYSHLMGTDRRVREKVNGVGLKLKILQRENNLARGNTEIRWTCDPLQPRNANVNIRKCGAIAQVYKRDVYDLVGINEGVAADRFETRWPISSERVAHRLNGQGCNDEQVREIISEASKVNFTVSKVVSGLLEYRLISGFNLELQDSLIVLEIPINFPDMMRTLKEDIERTGFSAAADWREKTRLLFETYFSKRYVVRDFHADNNEGRAFYLLEKDYKPK